MQTMSLLPEIVRAEAVLAMFESEGHLLAAMRYARLPGVRRPVFGILACWLAEVLPKASPRKLDWYRRLYSTVDVVFVLSSSQVDFVANLLDIRRERVRFIHFGIDEESFAPEFATEGEYVLAAGRDRGRDWPTLLAAARQLDVPFRVLARARDLDGLELPKNVEMLGYRPFEQYRELLLGARVVVVPTDSRPYPTGQTVMLEAMAAGKATVVTETAAIGDYLTGDNALAVRVGDADGLAAAIDRSYRDATVRRSLCLRARSYVLTNATATAMWSAVHHGLSAAQRSAP